MDSKSSCKNKVIFLITLLAMCFTGFAQSPHVINYQGVARNSMGNPLANQKLNLRLSVRNLSTTGALVYSETRLVTTNGGGLYTVQIGGVGATATSGTIEAINWQSGYKFLQVEVDPSAGNNFIDLGTTQFVSVPYALSAGVATPVGRAAGDLSGTYPNPSVANGAISTVKIADAAVTDAKLVAISGSKVSGNIGGDANNVTGIVAIANGGTGASTSAEARTKLELGNIDNTSDLDKNISTATQAALNLKEGLSNKSDNVSLGNSDLLYPTQNAVKTYVDEKVTAATIADADNSTKGKLQLAGDLGGTAAAPTVPGLASKANAADVATSLATKANAADVTTSLASKANAADVATSLATKANAADVTTSLASKANTADVNTNLALKEDISKKSTIATLGNSDDLYPTQKAVKTYVDLQVASATIADADNSTKGKIQLAGDLGGTAATPTVPGLGLKAPLASPTFTGTVTTDVLNAGTLSASSVTTPVYASIPVNLTFSGSTIDWNPALGLNAAITLTGNGTLNFTSPLLMGSYGTIVLTQDGVGSRTITLPTIANVTNKILGSTSTSTVALSTAANSKDILNFYYDGTNCYWNLGQGYGATATVTTNANLTGDVTSSGNATTLSASGVTAGTYGSATAVPSVTIDSKGRVTSVTNTTITAPSTFTGSLVGDVTGTQSATVVGKINGTSLSGLTTGLLKNTTTTGVPSIAIAGTDYVAPSGSITGNAATVTTNANLTGPITSVGNTTTIASQTGSGSTFVMNTAPILVTPNLGTPSAAVLTNATGLSLTSGITGTLLVANGGTGATSSNSAFNALAPTQTSNSGKYLTTDGTNTSWGTVASTLPTTVNNSTNYNIVMATGSNASLVTGTGHGGNAATLNPYTGQMSVSGLTAQGYGVTSPMYASTPQTLMDGTTISWNPLNGLNASILLGGNRTLSFSGTLLAGSYGTLVVTQDGTGGRTLTLPSTANKVLGSASTTTIALSSAAGAKDILNFYYDGTNYYWNIDQGYGQAATVASTNLASGVTGTLLVANGGTGATTLTGYIKGSGTSTMTATATIPLADVIGAAPLASPSFTGDAIAVTASAGDNDVSIATTAFVTTAVASAAGGGTHFLGEQFGGGTVFYINSNGTHGLIVENADLGSTRAFIVDGVSSSGSNGTNTMWMVGARYQSKNPLAHTTTEAKEFFDWEIPEIYELHYLYQAVNSGNSLFNTLKSNLGTKNYWSNSFEQSYTQSYMMQFSNGVAYNYSDRNWFNVRCIRRF